MAAYDYLCLTCGAVTEVHASFAEKAAGLAPQCSQCKGEELRQVFSTVGVRTASASSEALPLAGGGCCGGSCGCG